MENQNEDKVEQKKMEKSKKETQSNAFALSELCFILLPFVVIIITFGFKENLVDILKVPEWSLASSVMFGQSIIKVIHGIGKNYENKIIFPYRAGALVSLIILFGLVPSLTVLSLIFTFDFVPIWLIMLQFLLFILAILLFSMVNVALIQEEEEIEKENKE